MQSDTEAAKWYLFSIEMRMWMWVQYLFVFITVANTKYLLQGCPSASSCPAPDREVGQAPAALAQRETLALGGLDFFSPTFLVITQKEISKR